MHLKPVKHRRSNDNKKKTCDVEKVSLEEIKECVEKACSEIGNRQVKEKEEKVEIKEKLR